MTRAKHAVLYWVITWKLLFSGGAEGGIDFWCRGDKTLSGESTGGGKFSRWGDEQIFGHKICQLNLK